MREAQGWSGRTSPSCSAPWESPPGSLGGFLLSPPARAGSGPITRSHKSPSRRAAPPRDMTVTSGRPRRYDVRGDPGAHAASASPATSAIASTCRPSAAPRRASWANTHPWVIGAATPCGSRSAASGWAPCCGRATACGRSTCRPASPSASTTPSPSCSAPPPGTVSPSRCGRRISSCARCSAVRCREPPVACRGCECSTTAVALGSMTTVPQRIVVIDRGNVERAHTRPDGRAGPR